MDRFVITGGAPLAGEIPTSGSKNSALPALAAAMLTDEPVTLHRIPRVRDIRTMQRLLKRVANRAAVLRPVTPHILRHTFAVTAVQKGISLPSLQRLLGHKYLGTTQIYLNLSPEDVIGEFRRKW